MSVVVAEKRGRRRHTRRVGYRSSYLDPYLEFRRKLKTASFVPVVAMIFRYLKVGAVHSGMSIAQYCRGRWSQGTVWSHVHWLSAKGILQPKFDGKQMWYGWPKAMNGEPRIWYGYLRDAVNAYRLDHRKLAHN